MNNLEKLLKTQKAIIYIQRNRIADLEIQVNMLKREREKIKTAIKECVKHGKGWAKAI